MRSNVATAVAVLIKPRRPPRCNQPRKPDVTYLLTVKLAKNNNTVYEYWDAELKTQSKKRLAMLEQAIKQTGAIITDRYENKIFKDPKLLWRNPLLLKVKLPRGKRWKFILTSKCMVWLAKPPKLGIPKPPSRYVRRGDPTAYCVGYCDPTSRTLAWRA